MLPYSSSSEITVTLKSNLREILLFKRSQFLQIFETMQRYFLWLLHQRSWAAKRSYKFCNRGGKISHVVHSILNTVGLGQEAKIHRNLEVTRLLANGIILDMEAIKYKDSTNFFFLCDGKQQTKTTLHIYLVSTSINHMSFTTEITYTT